MIQSIRQALIRLAAHPKAAAFFQFIKFSLVGVSNTLISLGIYYLCLYAFHWHYQLSNAVSYLISMVNAYYWNSRFVFHSARTYTLRQHLAAFLKSLVSYGGTFLLNAALLSLLVEALHISEGLAPIAALVITYPVNYLLNKHWAFRKQKEDPDAVPDK